MENLVLKASPRSRIAGARVQWPCRQKKFKAQDTRRKAQGGEKREKGGKGETGETRALHSGITEACDYVIPAQAASRKHCPFCFLDSPSTSLRVVSLSNHGSRPPYADSFGMTSRGSEELTYNFFYPQLWILTAGFSPYALCPVPQALSRFLF
jgi:hypothetical protein